MRLFLWTAVALGFRIFGGAGVAEAEVVVLRNGQVYQGTVRATERDNALMLETSNGPVALATVRIEARGESLPDVYQTLAASASTPARHQALGRWCLQQGLFTQAEEQFEQLNTRLRAAARAELDAERDELETRAAATPASRRKATPLPERVDEIGPKATAAYRHRVRPLLMNSCASSGCHAATSHQKLTFHRRGRTEELATLDTMLQYIDRDEPSQSRLLDYARQPHGGATQIETDPRVHPDRYERLRQWVAQAARVETNDKTRGRPVVDISNGAVRILVR